MTSKRASKRRTRQQRLGQYYTPDWVVDYIIQNTLGPAIEADPSRLLGEFTVLDPACGDGAFLVGALRFLSNKVKTMSQSHQPIMFRSIVDSIHGVDVDPDAVESCQKRLSEISQTLLGISADFSQRVLLGNSLIQDDDNAQQIFGNKLAKVYPLVWHRVYPWVMRDGGFDVIVGNPPFIGNKSMDSKEKQYIRKRYSTVHQQFDILIPFIELGLQLLRPNGRLGFIISNKVLASDYGKQLRKLIVNSVVLEQMVDLSHLDLFKDAATYPHIIILRKAQTPDEIRNNQTLLLPPPSHPDDFSHIQQKASLVPQQYYNTLPNTILTPALSPEKFKILQQLYDKTTPLGELCTIRCGIAKTGFSKKVFTAIKYDALSSAKKRNTLPFLAAGDVRRYKVQKRKYLTYSAKLCSPEQWQDFTESKLVIAGMGKHLRVALDTNGSALGRVYYITQNRCTLNLYFLLALLNSRLINAYFTFLFIATHLRSGYLRYNATYLEQIPVAPVTKRQQDDLAELAIYAQRDPKNLKKGLDLEINQYITELYGIRLKDVETLER